MEVGVILEQQMTQKLKGADAAANEQRANGETISLLLESRTRASSSPLT